MISMSNNLFNGLKIIEDLNMVVPGEPFEKKRTIKERLFSLPWRPFKRTKTITLMVPSREIIFWENHLVMHPVVKDELLRSVAKSEQSNNQSKN